jgi:hypothetical protein
MRNYTDHLSPRMRRVGQLDALTYGRHIGERAGGEKLVDDHHVPPRSVIVLGECASREQRRAQRFEVAGHHLLHVGIFGTRVRRGRSWGGRIPGARPAA